MRANSIVAAIEFQAAGSLVPRWPPRSVMNIQNLDALIGHFIEYLIGIANERDSAHSRPLSDCLGAFGPIANPLDHGVETCRKSRYGRRIVAFEIADDF